jgi:hypothetical protein
MSRLVDEHVRVAARAARRLGMTSLVLCDSRSCSPLYQPNPRIVGPTPVLALSARYCHFTLAQPPLIPDTLKRKQRNAEHRETGRTSVEL